MTVLKPEKCSVCALPFSNIVIVDGRRRNFCSGCGHSERIDKEPFDYGNFAMGSTGSYDARLQSQAQFILPHLKPGTRAIEIGCADGGLGKHLKKLHDFSRYEGVEMSPARTLAAQCLDAVHAEPIEDLVATGKIERGQFDLALASHLIEHLDEPGSLIDGMSACLAPDGLIFLEAPNRSGHPLITYDDNQSHWHFFSVASLSRLLVDRGFHCIAIATGARLDARYPDSIRLIASRRLAPADSPFLSDSPHLAGSESVVVWGAGGMVSQVLAQHFDPKRIAYFVDRDPGKWGRNCLGAEIRSPEVLRSDPGRLVVIASIEMETAIRQQIDSEFSDCRLDVKGIADLLDKMS